jgi:FixJ family two-component response regulator
MPKRSVLIAVVDDEESVRKALGRLISAAGFDVQIFSSGPDFLRSTQQRPHCVVLDVRMPHMDGFEVQRTLMRADEPVPVIIITGDDSADCRARALQQGAKAYLRKPVDDALLLEAIESALLPGSRESGVPR